MNGPDQAGSQFALPLLFVLFGPSGDWTMSPTRRREIFTQWLMQMLISLRNTLTDTPSGNVSPALWVFS